jgi:hypothetical protein
MFGDLARSFGRTFLIAHLVPAILFVSVNMIVVIFGLLAPPTWIIWEKFGIKYLDQKTVVLLLIAFFLGIILQQFNTQIIKIYEGYCMDWFPKWFPLYRLMALSHKHQNRLYCECWKDIQRSKGKKEDTRSKEFRLTRSFPDKKEILPTTLGNIVRAFESYVSKIYNIDPITGWIRLTAVIPRSYKEEIEKSQNDFNFILNLSFLSAILGIEWLLLPGEISWLIWLFILFCCFIMSYLFYRISCVYARGWGEYVRSAFDLYRFELLKQMGVALPSHPITLKEEMNIWGLVQEYTFFVVDPKKTEYSPELKFLPRFEQSKQTNDEPD